MAYKDPEKARAATRDWMRRNPEANRAASRRYDASHREERTYRNRASRKTLRGRINNLLGHAKYSAKKKSLAFNIDASDIHIPCACPVLGILLDLGAGPHADNLPSLDRIDPTIGYVKGNVWVISWRANRIKQNATLEELEALVVALKRLRIERAA